MLKKLPSPHQDRWIMETAGDPEMLAHIYQTTLCHISQNSYLWSPPSETQISQDQVKPKNSIFCNNTRTTVSCCHCNAEARANTVTVTGSLWLSLYTIMLQNRHITLLTPGSRFALRLKNWKYVTVVICSIYSTGYSNIN